ncbi:MAG TPA: tetratricopeptide repeat protein [Rhizomicrobium sp.]|nr:tetratricopeptide repeat protein [Rhizomicrobium sp.]
MTRTTLYKGVYFAMFGSAAILALGVLAYFQFSPLAFLVVVVALLIPGRILGYFWRDLLRGLRLLNAKDYVASKVCSERFLVEVREKPWIRHFIWLGSSTYSRDPEVLALNNLGAAELALGEVDVARAHLEEAIAKDPLCPLPFFNLGALFKATGNVSESERCFAEATRLGFRHGISDKIVRASQTRFAEMDGR